MKKKHLLYALILSIICGVFSSIFFILPVNSDADSVMITIPKGSSPRAIAEELYRNSLIRSKAVFLVYLKVTQGAPLLRAGTFELSASDSLPSIIHMLQTQSGMAHLLKVTIPEGLSIWDIEALLEKNNIVEKGVFSEYSHKKAKYDFLDRFEFLKDIPVDTVEGYLFPDTYFFEVGSEPKKVVFTMISEFEKQVIPLWETARTDKGSPKSRFSFHQILSIAALIEKEARISSEMRTISSVFYNRLKRRMPLASDPTVVYALGRSYKQKVYYKDLKIESPYNTYKYSGFTPSPIASMGKKAFAASLDPETTPFLFFVGNKDGSHSFSETYDEHLRIQRRKSSGTAKKDR